MTNPLDRIAADACGASRPAAINEDATREAVLAKLKAEVDAAFIRYYEAQMEVDTAVCRYNAAKEARP